MMSSFAVSAGELTIYSTTDGDNLKVIGKAFAEAHPDIKVSWVRDSTGIMHSRIMAEKDNPRHDVLFGMAATSMLTMDELGMFIPYTPKGVEKLDTRYRIEAMLTREESFAYKPAEGEEITRGVDEEPKEWGFEEETNEEGEE